MIYSHLYTGLYHLIIYIRHENLCTQNDLVSIIYVHLRMGMIAMEMYVSANHIPKYMSLSSKTFSFLQASDVLIILTF